MMNPNIGHRCHVTLLVGTPKALAKALAEKSISFNSSFKISPGCAQHMD